MGFVGGREPRTGGGWLNELAGAGPQRAAEMLVEAGLTRARAHLMAVAKLIDAAPERDGEAHVAALTLVAGLDDLAERFKVDRPPDSPQ